MKVLVISTSLRENSASNIISGKNLVDVDCHLGIYKLGEVYKFSDVIK